MDRKLLGYKIAGGIGGVTILAGIVVLAAVGAEKLDQEWKTGSLVLILAGAFLSLPGLIRECWKAAKDTWANHREGGSQ